MKLIKKSMTIFAAIAFFALAVPAKMAGATGVEEQTVSVTYDLVGVTASSMETQVPLGSAMNIEFTPQDGYDLPEDVTVEIAGAELSDGYTYENGVLVVDEVYGDMVIRAYGVNVDDAESEVYSITYDLYKVTASKQDGNVSAGSEYRVKLEADSGFSLKSSNVAVSVNGGYMDGGYSFDDGVLVIDSVDGDILIEAIAEPKDSGSGSESGGSGKKGESGGNSGGVKAPSGSTSNSKSAQALSQTGGSARDYTTGSYVAPKTGDGLDIRFYGAFALFAAGIGLVVIGRRRRM